MVKLLKYTAIFLFLIVLLVFSAGSWLLYSPSGTSWLLQKLPEWAGLELTIGEIEGTLAGTLQLKNIELHQQEQQLSLEHFSIQNQLRGLLPLTLEIEQLQVRNLQIKSTAEQQSSTVITFSWPELPWLLDFLQIDLNNFNLQNLSWKQKNQEPLQIELFQGDLQWENGTLQGNNLTLQSGELQGAGSFSCELKQPALTAKLQIATDDSAAAWQEVKLQTDLHQGDGAQILNGSITINLTAAEGKQFTAVSEVELTAEQLQLRQLTLSRPDHPGNITADAMLNFSSSPLELSSSLQLNQIDLEEETGQPVNLSGTIQIEGNPDTYSGKFNLKNLGSGLTDSQLAGDFTGTQDNISLINLRGKWLNGVLDGQAQIGWKQGWQLRTQLSGREIDPQKFYPQLAGRLNLDLQANLNGGEEQPPQGTLQLQLQDSTLHNYPLSGIAELHLQDNSLQIDQLQLQGEGIQLQASGNPEEKLTYSWQVKDLEHLLANTSGQFSGNGWLSWQQQSLRIALQASGKNLAFEDWQLDQLSLQVETAENEPTWKLQLNGQSLHYQQLDLDVEKISIRLKGDLNNHSLMLDLTQAQNNAATRIQGSWNGHQWQGEISSFQVMDSPFGNWHLQQAVPILLSADQLSLKKLSVHSDNGGELQLQGDYQLKQQQGTASIFWQNLDLSLFDPLIPEGLISGLSDGSVNLERGEKNRLQMKITTHGEIQYQQLKLKLEHSDFLFNWDESGLQSSLQISLADGSHFNGILTSTQKNNFVWPQQGEIQLSGEGIPLGILQPWLPDELSFNGTLDLNSHGDWQADEPLNLSGSANINNGYIHWQEEKLTNDVKIESAELNWQWNKELNGNFNLKLEKRGNIKTTFSLPLAAARPWTFDPDGPVNVDLHTSIHELGLLSVYFPEYFQKSRAKLNLDLQLNGSWLKPNLTGQFDLLEAEMFLASAGIQLGGIELQGNVSGTYIEVTNLKCSSGSGKLSGSGHLDIKNWLPETYHLQLKGKNFQLFNYPELQVSISPDLEIDGTMDSIKVRGEIKLPAVQINDQQEAGVISNSPDLEFVDTPIQESANEKFKYDIDLQLILGGQVFLYAANIDAQLGGKLRIRSDKKQELIGYGKIHVIHGTYFGLGANLNINYGYISFTGGPLEQPDLDVLALRRLNEVEVGAKVSGTPQEPDVQLYSRPTMPEGDIISYLLTGQPMSASRSQTNLLMTAAGALVPQGKSRSMVKELGVDTFYISSDYESGSGEDSTTVITTGKYLNPDLYLSFGYSPDGGNDRIKLRYRLTPTWDIESTLGYDSGADLFYRIEFD